MPSHLYDMPHDGNIRNTLILYALERIEIYNESRHILVGIDMDTTSPRHHMSVVYILYIDDYDVDEHGI